MDGVMEIGRQADRRHGGKIERSIGFHPNFCAQKAKGGQRFQGRMLHKKAWKQKRPGPFIDHSIPNQQSWWITTACSRYSPSSYSQYLGYPLTSSHSHSSVSQHRHHSTRPAATAHPHTPTGHYHSSPDSRTFSAPSNPHHHPHLSQNQVTTQKTSTTSTHRQTQSHSHQHQPHSHRSAGVSCSHDQKAADHTSHRQTDPSSRSNQAKRVKAWKRCPPRGNCSHAGSCAAETASAVSACGDAAHAASGVGRRVRGSPQWSGWSLDCWGCACSSIVGVGNARRSRWALWCRYWGFPPFPAGLKEIVVLLGDKVEPSAQISNAVPEEKLTASREAFTHNIPQSANDIDQFLDFPSLWVELFPHPRVFISHRIQLRSYLDQLIFKEDISKDRKVMDEQEGHKLALKS